MGNVIHFEITADNTDRAIKFYAEAFGWVSTEYMEGYNTVKTGEGEGIDGAIMKREFQAQPTIAWIAVDDLYAAIEKVKVAGGSLVGERQYLENIGDTTYAKDTEGNVFGIIQPAPRA